MKLKLFTFIPILLSLNLALANTPQDLTSSFNINHFKSGPNEILECIEPSEKSISSLTCKDGSRLKSKSFTSELTSGGKIINTQLGITPSIMIPSPKIVGVSSFNDILFMQYVSDGEKMYINFEVSMCEHGLLINSKSTIVGMNILGEIHHRENPFKNCDTGQLTSAIVEVMLKDHQIPVKTVFTVPTSDFCF